MANKNIVVLTRDKTYRKSKVRFMSAIKRKYKKYPKLVKSIENRHLNYNKQIDLIQSLEKDGHALYRYPTETVNVTRLKGDKKDLIALYELGRKDMEASREEIYKLIK